MVARSKKQKVLTKEEEEAKSQAYINKLLAQEQETEDIYSLNYYEGYGNSLADSYEYNYDDFDDDDNDDDYEYSRYGKNNNKRNRKKNNDDNNYEINSRSSIKKKNTVKKTAIPKKRPSTDEGNNESSDDTKHRKINNPLGTYSPEEEAKFIEGINLYGRDWKNV
ncbi:hypothetical protein BCR36DRAFT_404689 [Piromyces finnis]|uniref:HTH myb-type domain-containing protein n=1 Tax=Piromyces finnis TaxID=1754191 RepID=A0A1Y1V8D9_9FUNG|nr:hypothetical protein BCR36DRAFT_404689 [Piromyces finnis]|eukprot:ORX49718.1 hypothetical protein BCR36DRAFT_404689 [Piromyces finnis]